VVGDGQLPDKRNEAPPPGVAWHVYVDRRLEDFSHRMDERFRGQQEAVHQANQANLRALEKVNEFRGALIDQNQNFVTLDALKELRVRLEFLEQSRAELEGRASESSKNFTTRLVIWGLALAALQIALWMGSFLWRTP
jgi:hypothetical protein